MKIKVGDMVEVISGSCKGKEVKVLQLLRSENRVIVEKINIVKKHVKPTNTNVRVIKKEKKAAKEVKKVTKTAKKTTKKESKK